MTELLKNKKFTNAISAFSLLYLIFTIWLCVACYAYYFEYSSLKTLYMVYCLFNALFAVPIVLSSKTILTTISTLLMFPVNLVLLIISIETGNWLIVIPTLLVNIGVFICLDLKYTTKAMLTTLSSVMFVIGIMGYILYTFLFGKFPFHNFSDSERYTAENSPNGQYRYVMYVREYGNTQKTEIYIESTKDDKNLGIVKLNKYNDNMKIYNSKDGIPASVVWESDTVINIDGHQKTVEMAK